MGFGLGILCSDTSVLMQFGSPGAWHATDTAWGHGQSHRLGTEPRGGDSRENSSWEDVHGRRCSSHSRLGFSPGTPFVLGTLARGRAISKKKRDLARIPFSVDLTGTIKPQKHLSLCSCPAPNLSIPYLGGYSQENCQESSPSFPRSFSEQGEPSRRF